MEPENLEIDDLEGEQLIAEVAQSLQPLVDVKNLFHRASTHPRFQRVDLKTSKAVRVLRSVLLTNDRSF